MGGGCIYIARQLGFAVAGLGTWHEGNQVDTRVLNGYGTLNILCPLARAASALRIWLWESWCTTRTEVGTQN